MARRPARLRPPSLVMGCQELPGSTARPRSVVPSHRVHLAPRVGRPPAADVRANPASCHPARAATGGPADNRRIGEFISPKPLPANLPHNSYRMPSRMRRLRSSHSLTHTPAVITYRRTEPVEAYPLGPRDLVHARLELCEAGYHGEVTTTSTASIRDDRDTDISAAARAHYILHYIDTRSRSTVPSCHVHLTPRARGPSAADVRATGGLANASSVGEVLSLSNLLYIIQTPHLVSHA